MIYEFAIMTGIWIVCAIACEAMGADVFKWGFVGLALLTVWLDGQFRAAGEPRGWR